MDRGEDTRTVPVSSIKLIDRVRPKSFCDDFAEQIDIAEKLYGRGIRFDFDRNTVAETVDGALQYSDEIRRRVIDTIMQMRRTYEYMF